MITRESGDRRVGLVFDAKQTGNVTEKGRFHVLCVGIGDYPNEDLSPIPSASTSARAVAQWFLDGALGSRCTAFNHPAKPLGSLAMLLSEPGQQASQFEGAEVPRGSFENLRRAVRAWISRGKTSCDNTLVLFLAGHGESFGRRTALLCDDYAKDPLDVTAGMTEIEQFIEALGAVDVDEKLCIFDCCRAGTGLDLRFDQQFGDRLISLELEPGVEYRRPEIFRSAMLGKSAFGTRGGVTLFTEALLEGMEGLAASPNENWQIDTGGLARTAADYMKLFRRDGDSVQRPDLSLSEPFVLSSAPPRSASTVFVSMTDPYDVDPATIRANGPGLPVQEMIVGPGAAPFARFEFPGGVPHDVAAFDGSGKVIAVSEFSVLPPVAFRRLPDISAFPPKRRTRGPSNASATLDLSLQKGADAGMDAAAVATIATSMHASTTIRRSLQLGAAPVHLQIPVGPSTLRVTTADGRVETFSLDGRRGDTISIDVPPVASPHEWLQSAILAGALDAVEIDASEGAIRLLLEQLEDAKQDRSLFREWVARMAPFGNLTEILDSTVGLDRLSGASPQVVALPEFSNLLLARLKRGPPSYTVETMDRDPRPELLDAGGSGTRFRRPQGLELNLTNADGRYALYHVDDEHPRRLPARWGDPEIHDTDRPVWVLVSGNSWREIGIVPSLGVAGDWLSDRTGETDPWRARLVVDRLSSPERSHIATFVDNRQWRGLLGFLARRDFENGRFALDDLLKSSQLREAVYHKVSNPFPALAAGLIAVATRSNDDAGIADQWLENVAAWFPGLPDGPIIVARLLLSGRRPVDRERARRLLLEAANRGIPVFSLSVDWLAAGLSAFRHDAECADMLRDARRWSQLSDPTRAFTVLRLPERP